MVFPTISSGRVLLPHSGDDLPFPVDLDRQLQELARFGNPLGGEDFGRPEVHLLELLVGDLRLDRRHLRL